MFHSCENEYLKKVEMKAHRCGLEEAINYIKKLQKGHEGLRTLSDYFNLGLFVMQGKQVVTNRWVLR